jgi:glutathione S-transferase
MMKLYYSKAACSLATHIALEEAGVPFEVEAIDISAGTQRNDGYLAKNPLGRVPVLELEDGRVLTEVPAILEFIASSAPKRGLLPSDPWLKVKASEWMSLFVSSVHPTFLGYYRPERFVRDRSAQDALRTDSREKFFSLLELVERQLPERGWVLGEAYSLCDAYALIFFLWARHFEFPLTGLPRYSALAERVLARPATARAIEREGLNQLTKAAS